MKFVEAALRAPAIAVAPGRVNLLGEHTDYSGGLVLPMAIPFTTQATITPRQGHKYEFASGSFDTVRSLDQCDRSPKIGDWSDYPVGILRELQELGFKPPPFRLFLNGNVPLGAGLSSSASIEVATAVALLSYMDATMSASNIALLCQRAENRYVHSPCGIMDQFVITAAVAGHALLLNTKDLSYEILPMENGALIDCSIVIVNSRVRHSVGEGVYGLRRSEVEQGQAAIVARFPSVKDLSETSPAQLQESEATMSRESFLRCRHIITENARVLRARVAMLDGDPGRLGQVMTEAHASYRDDFAASIEEIDFLVQAAINLPGCYGSRLTGGGFGGCTVNLIKADQAEYFSAKIRDDYEKAFAVKALVYTCKAVDGAIARRRKEI